MLKTYIYIVGELIFDFSYLLLYCYTHDFIFKKQFRWILTLDWCEKNYEVSYYIAEFFNTISSLCLICMGTFGSIMHAKGFDYRFTLCFRM